MPWEEPDDRSQEARYAELSEAEREYLRELQDTPPALRPLFPPGFFNAAADAASFWGWSPSEFDAMDVSDLRWWHHQAERLVTVRQRAQDEATEQAGKG